MIRNEQAERHYLGTVHVNANVCTHAVSYTFIDTGAPRHAPLLRANRAPIHVPVHYSIHLYTTTTASGTRTAVVQLYR